MREARILRIVVASPSDVQAERDMLPGIIDELNRGIAADRGLRLELSRWETDAYPGFHPEGPQGLIDPILRIEDCDILIGIFWKRFGTPVSDARSGTEHEFKLAYEAWKQNGHPQIMVYFKQRDYTPKSKEEIKQLRMLLDFKEEFPKEGLWWAYKTKAEFQNLIRSHLARFLQVEQSAGHESRKGLSSHMSSVIASKKLRSEIRSDLERVLLHKDYPRVMSISGDLRVNPIWDLIPSEQQVTLTKLFQPYADVCPTLMHLDVFLIRADDPNGHPRLLTFYSNKPVSGWLAYLLLFRERVAGESNEKRFKADAENIASYLQVKDGHVLVSSLGKKYVTSIKPNPRQLELIAYIFEFCSVQISNPPQWLSTTECEYSLDNIRRRFRWFPPEAFEYSEPEMKVNADMIRAIYRLFSTTINDVPESMPQRFLKGER